MINGGKPLNGSIEISGMKNAAVAVIFASLLVEDTIVLENIPSILDVAVSLNILKDMGASVKMLRKNTVEINAKNARCGTAPSDMVRRMRASYYIIGAELGRFKKSAIAYPGGCDFGTRPIDQHIKAFESLGAKVELDGNLIIESVAENGLHGANVFFDMVTVGATMNLMIAAVMAEGVTVIDNAAREPHIVDLANFLNTCGADVRGAGTDTIKIKGVEKLHGCTYAIIPDMIEAGTYMYAAIATGGRLTVTNVIPKHLESITAKIEEMGVIVEEGDDSVTVSRGETFKRLKIKTTPYPGFPTDMQPQMCVLMCLADGKSTLVEGVWDNRFRYIDQLRRMGAQITVNDDTAYVEGIHELHPAKVRAVDLRAGAAMVIAGLAAKGITEIEDIQYIERGYDDIVGKLSSIGAEIKKVSVPDEIVFGKD